MQLTLLTPGNSNFARLEHTYTADTTRSLVTPYFDLRTTRNLLHLSQHVINQYEHHSTIYSTSQVYTTHRAVPTSQIAQNIKNINCRNIANMSQLNALTHSDHVCKVDDIHTLTALKCIDYIVLSYLSLFPAFAMCFSRRQSTLSIYSLFWIFRL